MTGTCSYAACHSPAVTQLDGWDFCYPHTAEHLGDPYAAPAVPLDADGLWEQEVWSRASDLASRLDAKIRRCRCCGEWAWHHDACAVCAAPAERANSERRVS